MVFCGLYVVISEMIVSNLPIGLRVFTVQHQLRRCVTGLVNEVRYVYEELPPKLVEQLHAPQQTGFVLLLIVAAGALAMAALLITYREMLPTTAPRS
jgi:hypothetical protein